MQCDIGLGSTPRIGKNARATMGDRVRVVNTRRTGRARVTSLDRHQKLLDEDIFSIEIAILRRITTK